MREYLSPGFFDALSPAQSRDSPYLTPHASSYASSYDSPYAWPSPASMDDDVVPSLGGLWEPERPGWMERLFGGGCGCSSGWTKTYTY